MALNADHEDMNKFSDTEGPYDDVKYCLQRIYDPLVESGIPEESKSHYIFLVKINTPGFEISESYPDDLWGVVKGVTRLSMGGSGTSGCIMFQSKTSEEKFVVTLGSHNYITWVAVATNFGDETLEQIRDSYYRKGKRNTPSVVVGSRYVSKTLMEGRSVHVTWDQEVDKNRYPTEVIVK